jgi:hypothetical protein
MVRAERAAGSIRRALARGDFYATDGVLLDRAETADGAYIVAVADATPGDHDIVFVGQDGKPLHRARGRSARLALDEVPPGYVRATVTSDSGERAWTQPVFTPAIGAQGAPSSLEHEAAVLGAEPYPMQRVGMGR